jgi:DNA-binding CsgD family transcriptional regulator
MLATRRTATLADDRRLQRSRLPSEVSAELREAIANELRQLSPNIEQALAEISLPIYVVDREGTIRWLNAAAIGLFGDRKGEHFSAVIAADGQQLANEKFARKVIGGARTTSYDVAMLARDGRRLDTEVESVRLDNDAEAFGVFGIVAVEKFANPAAAPQVHMTPRQLQVLKGLAGGGSTDMIAKELHISRETVRNHVRDLLRALGVHSRVQAVARAHQLGIV